MNYKLKLGAFLALLVGFLYFLTTLDTAVMNPKGAVAFAEKNLIETTFFLMLLVVIPVYLMIFIFARHYRADNPSKHVKYMPDWTNNSALEFTWWAIPTAIIITLAGVTWESTHELDPYKPIVSDVPAITVQVVALDWKWLFIYPEQHIATVNYLELPVGTPVNFMITSDAPMNSFWIPKLGGQVYAMSGMITQLSLIANEEGDYNGASSNFSGDGFAGMKFIAHAVSKQNFDAWVALNQHVSDTLSFENYPLLAAKSKDVPLATYALTDAELYNDILMKYMAPEGMMGMPSYENAAAKEQKMSTASPMIMGAIEVQGKGPYKKGYPE